LQSTSKEKMLAEPIFQFTEELSSAAAAAAAANSRIIPPVRTSLKRPSKLELKINLNEQQTDSMSPLSQTGASPMHLPAAAAAVSNNATHSHDKNNNFLTTKQTSNR
jgi:hypothetical protein